MMVYATYFRFYVTNHFIIAKLITESFGMALHVYEKHPDYFNDKLDNFSLSIIKSSRPHDLERAEDYYIWLTRGDTLGLNRNKPVK